MTSEDRIERAPSGIGERNRSGEQEAAGRRASDENLDAPRNAGGRQSKLTRSVYAIGRVLALPCVQAIHFNFSYSRLACCRMGTSASASFQTAKKS